MARMITPDHMKKICAKNLRTEPTRVTIVGAGINGLATAFFLHRSLGDEVQFTVVEGTD